MNEEVLERALQDRQLSHRALGVLLRIVHDRSVLSADRLSALGKEGRDAMRAALKELIERGYVTSEKARSLTNETGWKTIRVLADPVVERAFPRRGFSARRGGFPAKNGGFSGANSHNSHLVESTPTPKGVGVLSLARGASIVEEAPVPGWEGLFESTEKPEPRTPKTTRSEHRAARSQRRAAKPPSQWSSTDIAEEFQDRLCDAIPVEKRIGQAGTVELTKILGAWIRDGYLLPAEGQPLVDLFFSDLRNLNRVGFDLPLWKRFVQAIPTLKGQARIRAGLDRGPEISLEDAEAEAQDALRRLLG